MKKRVLVINTVTTSVGNGIFKVAYSLAKSSSDEYIYDFVLAGKNEDQGVALLKEFCDKIFISPVSRIKNPVSYMKWLKKKMYENDYDIIHIHGNSATMLLDLHPAYELQVPIRICHVHSTSCKFKTIHFLLKNRLNKEITHGLACSKEAGEWLFYRDYVIMKNAVDVKDYVFDLQSRNYYRKEFSMDDSFVVGHVGYFGKEKNHGFIISIAEKIIKHNPKCIFLLLGDGKLFNEVRNEIVSKGLENNFRLVGKRSDASRIYSAMDAFIFPSIFEGFGLSIVEAQINGLPCIASNNVPETTCFSTDCFYYSLDDQQKWISAIEDIEKRQTEKNRRRDSSICVENVSSKGFSLKSSVMQLKSIYSAEI